MDDGNCQVCGLRIKVGADGMIARHTFKTRSICLGSYALPVAKTIDFEAVVNAIDHWSECSARLRAKFDPGRPLPANFWRSWSSAAAEQARLIKRLRELRLGMRPRHVKRGISERAAGVLRVIRENGGVAVPEGGKFWKAGDQPLPAYANMAKILHSLEQHGLLKRRQIGPNPSWQDGYFCEGAVLDGGGKGGANQSAPTLHP